MRKCILSYAVVIIKPENRNLIWALDAQSIDVFIQKCGVPLRKVKISQEQSIVLQ